MDTNLSSSAGAMFPSYNLKFKTNLCKNYISGLGCQRGQRCHFAHGDNELRKEEECLPGQYVDEVKNQQLNYYTIPYCNYKTVRCKLNDQGFCKFAQNCRFAHGDPELRNPHDPMTPAQVQSNQTANMVFVNAYLSQPPPMATLSIMDKLPQQQQLNQMQQQPQNVTLQQTTGLNHNTFGQNTSNYHMKQTNSDANIQSINQCSVKESPLKDSINQLMNVNSSKLKQQNLNSSRSHLDTTSTNTHENVTPQKSAVFNDFGNAYSPTEIDFHNFGQHHQINNDKHPLQAQLQLNYTMNSVDERMMTNEDMNQLYFDYDFTNRQQQHLSNFNTASNENTEESLAQKQKQRQQQLEQMLKTDPTRLVILNNNILVKEQIRLANEYFKKLNYESGLLVIENLLNKGDIGFQIPAEWIYKSEKLIQKLQLQMGEIIM
eukprot:403371038